MQCLPPHVVRVDDIVIRHLSSGRYGLAAQPTEYHRPHLCLALLMINGQLLLEDEHRNKLELLDTSNVVISPWRRYALTLSGSLLSVKFPSYRLNACSLIPLWSHQLSDEQSYLLDTMLREMVTNNTSLESDAQRFVANALSTMVALPERDERRHDLMGNEDPNISLRAEIARTMRDRMHEPHLRAEDVTGNLNISRAQLYRVMSPYGGFKTCLQALRLDGVARRLKSPTDDPLSIKAILFQNGFSTTEQFQRLFYKRFKVSARDFRRGTPPEPGTFGGFHAGSPCLSPATR